MLLSNQNVIVGVPLCYIIIVIRWCLYKFVQNVIFTYSQIL